MTASISRVAKVYDRPSAQSTTRKNVAFELSAGQGISVDTRFLCRISGLPTDVTEGVVSEHLGRICDQLFALGPGLQRAGEEAADALFAAIGRSDDRKQRHHLLSLRRAVFNGRMIGAPAVADALPAPDSDLLSRIAVYQKLIAERAIIIDLLKTEYVVSLSRAREHIRAATTEKDFRRGLMLSSDVLTEQSARYGVAAKEMSLSRQIRVERGLLRYLTRASMKATPFAGFCTIAQGVLVPDAVGGIGVRSCTMQTCRNMPRCAIGELCLASAAIPT